MGVIAPLMTELGVLMMSPRAALASASAVVSLGSTSGKSTSVAHALSQPSPLIVLLSSHISVEVTAPFPQTGPHTFGALPTHAYPASTVHADEQPSPLIVLPSSQTSPPTFVPSPQTPVHMLGAPEHMYPLSTAQRCEHPSPSARLPSSQASPAP